MIHVLLVDDHRLIRQSLRTLLEMSGRVQVLQEASDGLEALAVLAEEHHPKIDMVIMDISMPNLDGIATTARIHALYPDLPILMLTMHGEPAVIRDAIAAGAAGFVTKDAASEHLVDSVEAVMRGIRVFPEVAAERLVADDFRSELSAREREVLQLVADGHTTESVAETLFISVKTVKNHLASIYEKLDARDRTQAVLRGLRAGILRLN